MSSVAATDTPTLPPRYTSLWNAGQNIKSEYIHGEILAMSGASRAHNLITVDATTELNIQSRSHGCEVYSGDMRVRTSRTGSYFYPDVVVVCDKPRFEDNVFDTLLNPTLIVEVLSPSTEVYDRGEKFAHYQELASLREYPPCFTGQDSR